jgi:hypothetical protein
LQENVRTRDYLKHPSVDEKMIFKWIFMKCGEDNVAQDRVQK